MTLLSGNYTKVDSLDTFLKRSNDFFVPASFLYLVLVCALALLSFEFQVAWSIIFPQ